MSKFAIVWNASGGKHIICAMIVLTLILAALAMALSASYNKEEDVL